MTANNNKESCGNSAPVANSNPQPVNNKVTSKLKSSENRKIRKPLMEKRRRARINQSLNELKKILLEANGAPSRKEGSRPAKLEKADILELTVRHLKGLNDQVGKSPLSTKVSSTSISDIDDDSSSCSIASNPTSHRSIAGNTLTPTQNNGNKIHQNNNIESPFINGFAECIRIVDSVKSNQIPQKLREKLQTHLADLHRQHPLPSPTTDLKMENSMQSYVYNHFIQDDERCMKSPGFDTIPPVSISGNCKAGNKISRTFLLPTRMPNGDFAFVLKYAEDKCSFMDVDIPYDRSDSIGHIIKAEGHSPNVYMDNHHDIDHSRVLWRPW